MPPADNSKKALLQDSNVKRWFDNVGRGSPITADVYLRRLNAFCSDIGLTPKDLIAQDESALHDHMLDCVSRMERAGKAGSYIESTLKAVKSWLSHNGKDSRRRIKIRGARDTPSLKDERVPTRDELKRIFLSGGKKARVACALVAHSGTRIEVLGNYTGNDGLRIGDFPEISVEREVVRFERKPTLIVIRKELSKANHQYLTFLSEEGCEYLEEYLNERLREDEELTSKSPIVTPKQRMKSFIRANNIGDTIRETLRAAGLAWRPYVLRSYFDTQLMLAESKGLVLRDYRQFWMGHKGDVENRYTTNKQRLPDEVIEDMREAYMRSQEFLQTTKPQETSEERLALAFRKQLFLVAGFSEEDVAKMDLNSIDDGTLQRVIREKLLKTESADCPKEKAVSVNEVNRFLAEGWKYVASLPNKTVIIRSGD